MATLFDIASLDAFLYGSVNGVDPVLPPDWVALNVVSPIPNATAKQIGFEAEAFQNSVTKEIVIAIRGTVVGNLANYEEDALLGTASVNNPVLNAVAQAATAFTETVADAYKSSTITISGHSLGGYAAQAATVFLLKSNILTQSAQNSLSTVTFNAPGLPPWLLALGGVPYPNAYNFFTQGDVIHLTGGIHIGQSTTVAMGPSATDEWNTVASTYTYYDPFSAASIIPATGALLSQWTGAAHALGNFVGINRDYNNQPGLFSENPTIGNQTAAQFFGGGEGVTASPLITVNSSGSPSLSDGSGDLLSIQGIGNTQLSSTLTVGSGTGLGVANVAALQAELATDGAQILDRVLLPATLLPITPGSALYGSVAANSSDGTNVAVGTNPSANATGLPGQGFAQTDQAPGSFVFNTPSGATTATEYIDPASKQGYVLVSGAGGSGTLSGGAASVGTPNTWIDAGSGTQYVFSAYAGGNLGTLTVSQGLLGTNLANSITISNFDISVADSNVSGFLGIKLPESLQLTNSASVGMIESGIFQQGSTQSYTLSVNVPNGQSQVIGVTVTGGNPGDFTAMANGSVIPLSPTGGFNVTLPAGRTSVSFSLTDTTLDNGGSDLTSHTSIQVAATLPSLTGGPSSQSTLTESYVPSSYTTDANQQPTDVITGVANGGGPGITLYQGDSSSDYAATTDANNEVIFLNSGNNSVVGNANINNVSVGKGNNIVVGNSGSDEIVAGNGNNEIYAGAKTNIQSAITAIATAAGTGVNGDLLAVGDGNNTIVGSNGNDFLSAGSGNNVVVLGGGQDTFWGGVDVVSASENWNFTGGVLNNAIGVGEGYNNQYPQPYNSFHYILQGTSYLASKGSDTIFAGNGNDFLALPNGNNYVELGSGSDTLVNGMGNDTVVAGSGNETIYGGGGTEYLYGGAGHDFINGGDGNNTVIGGSGSSTIFASAVGTVASPSFPNANLDSNYISGGSGNDLIYGSPGQDTLIAGTGNASVYGGSGIENILGGSGNDLLVGGAGNNTIAAGGSGIDTIYAEGTSSSTSYLYGGGGKDLIEGFSGTNFVFAGDGGTSSGATTVYASQVDSAALTTIYGGLGVDFLEGGSGTSVLYAGDGGTSVSPTSVLGFTGNDTIYGGLGTDFIQGGSGSNLLYAGDGGTPATPTTVSGGSGISTLRGGAGDALLIDTVSGEDVLQSAAANDTLVGIGGDTLVAGTGNDVLQSNSGTVNIEMNAGFGDDSIFSEGGNENISFGTGTAPTDFTGVMAFDGSLNSYLDLDGDGSTIQIQDGVTGGLGNVSFADSGGISVATLLNEVFTGDQSYTVGGAGGFTLNLTGNETVSAQTFQTTVASWANSATIIGGSGDDEGSIYSAGANAMISSVSGTDTINSVGANAIIHGGTLTDVINVSGANAIVTQASGSDIITVAGTDDTIVGGSGASTYYVNNASTVINSGTSTDTVVASVSFTAPTGIGSLRLAGSANLAATGNGSSDTLLGAAGQDTLAAGLGPATMIGGSGNTTFVVNNASDAVQDTFATANNAVQSSVSYSLVANVSSLVLTGTAALTATANSANDTLTSNAGSDTLIGGSGNDTFVINNASDVVTDTLGIATIIYQAVTNFTLPTSVNTLVLGGTAAVHATGNAGSDSIAANAGADTLSAGNGNATLVSGSGVDSLVGGTGNDVFVVNNASDIVSVGGAPGNDTIQSSVGYTASANIAALTLLGTASIAATGNTKTNVLSANSGADTLSAGTGIATLVGGSGNDTFVVNSASDVIVDTSSTATNTLNSSVNYTLANNVNSLIFTGTAALVGTANSANDTLSSNSGADTLIGGAGSETFVIANTNVVIQDTSTTATNVVLASVNYSLAANVNSLTLTGTAALKGTGNSGSDSIISNYALDTLIAGTGNDLFIVNNAADSVSAGSTHGSDTIQSAFSFTLPTNVNVLALSGSGNLVGTAISGNNSLIGNAGSDSLRAGSGLDTLVAGSGIDTLVGGTGTDWFVINNSSDVIQGIVAGANDKVLSSVNYSMAANVVAITLTGTGSLVATGNATSDALTGNAGSDTLIAGTGTATFLGGSGADLYIINSASDTVSEPNNKVLVDTIESSVSYTLPAGVSILALIGSANLSGTANQGGDVITGNAGSDTLTALTGNDTLIAGTGLSTLVGGSGDDQFIVNSVSDVVQDSLTGHNNVLSSSVTYSAPTNINILVLTGSGNLKATANSANDSLLGNSGSDTLVAGGGSDTLTAGSGLATLIGGSGADAFIVNNAADVVQSASSSSGNSLYSSASFSLPTNVNILTLTGFANIVANGNAAADTITAGTGQDTLVAGSGVATLVGGAGNDTFVVDSTSDVVQDSSITTANAVQASVNYSLVANVNSLVLVGTLALKGSANSANDTLTSNAALDTLVGGAGSDTFVISNSADLVQDTASTANNAAQSSVNYSLASNVNSLLLTGTAALKGTGNGGADTLTANSGIDTLVGGSGNDTFLISNQLDVVQDTSTTATNSLFSSVSYTLPTHVNALTLTGTYALSATGNSAADLITGSAGADTLAAGSGVATLVGGGGNTLFIVNSASDVVSDSFASAVNTLQSSVSYSLAMNVNSLLLTGTNALTGTANSANDTLASNGGIDTLVGGAGNDVFVVNNTADVLQNVAYNDTIESSVTYTMPATSVQSLLLIGSANIAGTGNAATDTLTAGSGNDTLTAGSGVATLIGGAGNDVFVVNSTSDVVMDTSTTANNTIVSSVGYSLPANVDTLSLTGSSASYGMGNTDASNVIFANAADYTQIIATAYANTLYGGAGSDLINAGPGSNLIYAGSGANTTVQGGAAATSIVTQSTIYGGSGSDQLYGGPGADLVYAGTGVDSIYAGSGFDTIYGASGDSVTDTLSGYDSLIAGTGPETIMGTGTDTLVAGSGADVLTDTGAGSDLTFQINSGFSQLTVGGGLTNGENLSFGTGIEPGSFSISATAISTDPMPNDHRDLSLVLTSGANTISIAGAMFPGVVQSLNFADTGVESFDQLVNTDGPGNVTFSSGTGSTYFLSTGNNQAIGKGTSIAEMFAYGNNDTLSSTDSGVIYSYGNSSSITASDSWSDGNDDTVYLATYGENTLAGANDTVIAGSSGLVLVENAATIIEAATLSSVQVESTVNFSLPANVQSLVLDSDSILGSANVNGGRIEADGNFDTAVGASGADTLVADGKSDVLVGGSGADSYVLSDSSDSIQFGNGAASLNSVQASFSYTLGSSANTLVDTASNAVLTGNTANDSLEALYGVRDTLVAGSGNDTLTNNGSGSCTMIGGAGADTFNVTNPGDVVQDSFAGNTNTIQTTAGFSLPANVNNLVLNQYGSQTGTANGANDVITANSDGDSLVAGVGNDSLVANGSNETFEINPGFGHDTIVANGNDVIQFGAGIAKTDLTFTAVAGAAGSSPSLVISGDGGSVTVMGGLIPGNVSSVVFSGSSTFTVPQLVAPSGRTTVTGSSGNLVLSPSNADLLTAGSGQDTVISWGNGDTLTAGTGGTVIYAGGTGDLITGGNVNDTLSAIGANNTLVGSSGNESFIVNNATTIVQVTAGVGHDTVFSSVGYTVPTNVVNLVALGTIGLSLTANGSNDSITGTPGPDVLTDGTGIDTLNGDGGNDHFYVSHTNDVVEEPTLSPGAAVFSSVSFTLPLNVAQLVLTGPLIAGTGNAQNVSITDTYGIDTLIAGSGNDTLSDDNTSYDTMIGGSGNDYMAIGSYGDTVITGTGVDTLVATETSGASSNVQINNSADVLQGVLLYILQTSVSYTLSSDLASAGGPLEWDLIGSANIVADVGVNQDATSINMTGNAGSDTLIGGNTTNNLIAGTGVDTLIGGATGSTNYFSIDSGADIVLAQAGATNTVSSTASYTLPSNVSLLNLNASNLLGVDKSAGSNTLEANFSNDTLVAGSGSDTLLGVGNSDTLVAGSGNDVLTADSADTVVINSGYQHLEVSEAPAAVATVDFSSGIAPGNLTASTVLDRNGNGALAIADGSGAVTLDGALATGSYQFSFNGGSTLTLAQFLSDVHVTTSSVTGAAGNIILEGASSVGLTGGSGNDTIYAAATADTVTGGTGNQVLAGLGSNDSLIAGTGNDTLSGLSSGDTLAGGSAAATLIGGTAANVTFIVNNAGDRVQLQSSPGVDTVVSSIGYTLPSGVNALTFSGTSALAGTANTGADTLTSNSGVDTFIGGSGADLFLVNNALDVIQDTSTSAVNTAQASVSFSLPNHINNLILTGTAALTGTANASVNTLTSNSGIDTLIGGSAANTFVINNSADVVTDTASGVSNIAQSSVSYSLAANVNTLTLIGTSALSGTANNGTDTLSSNSGTDTLVGGSGNDTFVINASNDVVLDTSTTASNSAQSSVSYTLAINVNSLTLTGSAALTGAANAGTDTLASNTGVDTLLGGSGNDTFVINNSADVISDTSTTAVNIAKSGVSYSLATNINNLLLTGSASIFGTANSGNDSLTGNSGTDTLNGGMGSDTLVAGVGVDTLIGGTGNTTFVINSASDTVQDTASAASNTLRSSVTYSLLNNVNSLVLTGTAALKGSANNGADTLTANTGIDTLVGGGGNDTFVISNASDIIQDTSSSASNLIISTIGYTLPTDVNALTFTGSSALIGKGNAANDSLTGNSGADTLVAGNGTDTLVSGTGSAIESLVGGTGVDLFVVNYASDIVTVGSTHGVDTIQSSVSYTAAGNVANLTLLGTANLSGTGTSTVLNGVLTANSGNDTLTAGAGVETMVGGSGNDTFIVNQSSDVVTDTATSATNLIQSSANYTLVTNVNRLTLTGSAALVGTGNAGNDTLTADTGADTLVSGTGTAIDSLVGGTGADLFVVNNASDIVTVGGTHGVDTIQSSVSYSAAANVANLTLLGTAALSGTGSSTAGLITANTGNDTLTAISSTDTLVGGTGTDMFVVNNTTQVVSLGASGTSDTIQSSVSYTLPTNVQYLSLSGSSAIAGTGNSLTDLIIGNTANDTLNGGTGISVLEGGRASGSDQIKALSNQAALIGGAGSATMTGGAYKDFIASGAVSDSITTGATANVVSINKGDGATALQATSGATNVLSLGAGIDTESLYFTKTGTNLILTDGVSGDSITFTNWYGGAADQNYTNLQVVEIASANYNSAGSDNLRNKALEDFNFTALVAAFNTAGSPANWALSTAMPTAQLASSSTAAYGGDLAYYYGLNGNLTGLDLTAAQSTLTNASFGTSTQTIDAFSGINGGGGLHLSVVKPGTTLDRLGSNLAGDFEEASANRLDDLAPGKLPMPRYGSSTPSYNVVPRLGFESPIRSQATSTSESSELTTPSLTRLPQVRPVAYSTITSGAAIETRREAISAASIGQSDMLPKSAVTTTGSMTREMTPSTTAQTALHSGASIFVSSADALNLLSHFPQTLFGSPDWLIPINLTASQSELEAPLRSQALNLSGSGAHPVNTEASTATFAESPNASNIDDRLAKASDGHVVRYGAALQGSVVDRAPEVPARFVSPINVAWLTMHGILDGLDKLQTGGGAEVSEDHQTVTVDRLLASPSPLRERHPENHRTSG